MQVQPRDANRLAYTVLMNLAASQLELGHGVILDCPASRRTVYDDAVRLGRRWDAVVSVIDMQAPLDRQEWARRLSAKAGNDPVYRLSSIHQVDHLLTSYQGSWRWSESEDLDACR